MKTIKVLGSGCKKCRTVAEAIETKIAAAGADAQVVKVTDTAEIMGYGVMSTPAVVVDGKLVHSGSVPGAADIEGWLKS